MIRLILPILCLSLVPFVSVFADDSQRPGWVDGQGDEFPQDKYVIAVGSGKDRKAAENDAKRALAERFRSKVSSETDSSESEESSEDTNAAVSGKAKGHTATSLKVSATVDLRGMEILRRYQDPKTSEYFALAGIDRLKVRSSYSMELMKRKRQIEADVVSFDKSPSIAKGKKIIAELDAFDALSEEADSVGAGMPVTEALSGDKRDAIEEKMDELRAKNIVDIKVQGDDENNVGDLLGSCLTDEGFSLAADSDQQTSTRKISVKYSEKNKKIKVEGWEKYEFSLSILSPGMQKKLIRQEASGRNKEHAFDQVRDDLIKQACDYIANAVSK